MSTNFNVPLLIKECRSNEERVAFAIRNGEGILPFRVLVQRLYDYKINLTHEQIENALRRLLEENVIERCGEGRLMGYRFIADQSIRYGSSIAVRETPYLVRRQTRSVDLTVEEKCAYKEKRRKVKKEKNEVVQAYEQMSLADLPNILATLASKKNKVDIQEHRPESAVKAPNASKGKPRPRYLPSSKTDEELLEFVIQKNPTTDQVTEFLQQSRFAALDRLYALQNRGKIDRSNKRFPWMGKEQYQDECKRMMAEVSTKLKAKQHTRQLQQERKAKLMEGVPQLRSIAEVPPAPVLIQNALAASGGQIIECAEDPRRRNLGLRSNKNWKSDQEILDFIKTMRPRTDDVMAFLEISRPPTLKRLHALETKGLIRRYNAYSPWEYIQPVSVLKMA